MATEPIGHRAPELRQFLLGDDRRRTLCLIALLLQAGFLREPLVDLPLGGDPILLGVAFGEAAALGAEIGGGAYHLRTLCRIAPMTEQHRLSGPRQAAHIDTPFAQVFYKLAHEGRDGIAELLRRKFGKASKIAARLKHLLERRSEIALRRFVACAVLLHIVRHDRNSSNKKRETSPFQYSSRCVLPAVGRYGACSILISYIARTSSAWTSTRPASKPTRPSCSISSNYCAAVTSIGRGRSCCRRRCTPSMHRAPCSMRRSRCSRMARSPIRSSNTAIAWPCNCSRWNGMRSSICLRDTPRTPRIGKNASGCWTRRAAVVMRTTIPASASRRPVADSASATPRCGTSSMSLAVTTARLR